MAKLFQRRFPTYFLGFSLGLAAVVLLLQMKKVMAPDFAEVKDIRPIVPLRVGGSFKLQLGEEPGKYLAWGFPTQLAVGKKGAEGRVQPVLRIEYKDLVEKETLLGPFHEVGEYELLAQFFTCAHPGEKYCAQVVLEQPFTVVEGEAPVSAVLAVDVKSQAEKASAAGQAAPR